jgi:hypothetical protein
MDQNYQPSEPQLLSSPSPLPPSPRPLLPTNTSTTLEPLACPPLAIYSTKEALFQAIQSWSKLRGYAFTVGKSLRKKVAKRSTMHAIVALLPHYLRSVSVILNHVELAAYSQ